MKLKRFWYGLLSIAVITGAFTVSPAFAARPDSLNVLISDARPSTTSKYTITLDQATGTTLASTETVTATFPSGFTVPSFVAADATFTDNGSSKTVQDGACGSTDTVRITVASQVVTFTACNSYSGTSGSALVMTLGTGSTKATNHATPGTYQFTVAGTYGDSSQDAAIAIIGGVTLSATIDETLTHTTAGVTTGNCPNPAGAGSETEIDTSGDATTVPFGTINTEAFYGACQQLTVSTNAQLGYTTTVKTTTRPTSGSNVMNEDFEGNGGCDGSCTDTTEAAWATATNNGYGYCMSDQTGDPASTADSGWSSGNNGCNSGGTTFFKTINRIDASETGQDILKSAVSVSGDSAYIKYRITADATQAAGAYQTVIVYVSTGTF